MRGRDPDPGKTFWMFQRSVLLSETSALLIQTIPYIKARAYTIHNVHHLPSSRGSTVNPSSLNSDDLELLCHRLDAHSITDIRRQYTGLLFVFVQPNFTCHY